MKGFENAYIADIAAMVGIRESRNITTEYVLTGADLLSRKKFDDAFCQSNYPVDIHGYTLEFVSVSNRPKTPAPITKFPTARWSSRASRICSSRAAASAQNSWRSPRCASSPAAALRAKRPALPPPLRSMQKSPRAKLTAARSAKLWKTAAPSTPPCKQHGPEP